MLPLTLSPPASSTAALANCCKRYAGLPFPIWAATKRVSGDLRLNLGFTRVVEEDDDSKLCLVRMVLTNRFSFMCHPGKRAQNCIEEKKIWIEFRDL